MSFCMQYGGVFAAFSATMELMRTTISLFALTLILSSCGGGGGQETACDSAYWDGTVGTCVPTGWHIVDRAELDERGVPAEVVVAFQSDQPHSGQFATVTVTKESLARPLTTTEYSEASVQSVMGLPSFKQIDSREMTVDGADATLHIFSAKPSADEPESRFYQVSAVTESVGYTFTAAVPVSIEDALEEEIFQMLSNVTFEAPEGEGQESGGQ